MKSHILKRSFVFFFFLSLCIIINVSTLLTATIINKAYADSSLSIKLTAGSPNTENITVTFSQAVSSGDIIDIEVYNSSNQKSWQTFSTSGGTTFSESIPFLPSGSYTVSVGLFTQGWKSNYAWYNKIASFQLPNSNSSKISNITITPTTTPSQITAMIHNDTLSVAFNAYNNWKANYVTSVDGTDMRVKRPENNNDTVSEGMGYGMLLSEFASDQSTFQNLWNYTQKYLDSKGLMNWNIDSSGKVIGSGDATDADEDIAYALLLANKKWAGKGYDLGARNMVQAILNSEVSASNLIKPGDTWGNTNVMDPSYISPTYYHSFAVLSGNSKWNDIALANSNWLLRAANSATGLIPDWLNNDFSQASISWDTYPNGFYYDAIRTPIRELLAWKVNNDSNAQTILSKESNFFASVGTNKLVSGYTLSGKPLTKYLDAAFLSAYAAAGQVDSSSPFAQSELSALQTNNPNGYFGTSLRAITLFIIAGMGV